MFAAAAHRPMQDKTALITGAARGIGAACAQCLAEAGARVVVTDLTDSDGEAIAAQLRTAGAEALFQPLDVRSEAQWQEAVAKTIETFGGLDAVVNNAGIEVVKPLLETTLEDWKSVNAVNMEGVFLGVRESIAAMKPGGPAGKGGAIVNMSSVAGIIAIPGICAYSASKGGVRLLTKVAALECGKFGYEVRVNSVHPGFVETHMASSALVGLVDGGFFSDGDTATTWAKDVSMLKRFGEPRDIAEAVLYLCSDASRWVTGSELVVDGGYTAQ